MNLAIDAAKLKRLRMERAWSQTDLAKRAGVDVKTVNHAEAGKRLRLSNVRKLAKALKSPVSDITRIEE